MSEDDDSDTIDKYFNDEDEEDGEEEDAEDEDEEDGEEGEQALLTTHYLLLTAHCSLLTTQADDDREDERMTIDEV